MTVPFPSINTSANKPYTYINFYTKCGNMLFSLKISNNHFTKILSQAFLPNFFYNAAIWGHNQKQIYEKFLH